MCKSFYFIIFERWGLLISRNKGRDSNKKWQVHGMLLKLILCMFLHIIILSIPSLSLSFGEVGKEKEVVKEKEVKKEATKKEVGKSSKKEQKKEVKEVNKGEEKKEQKNQDKSRGKDDITIDNINEIIKENKDSKYLSLLQKIEILLNENANLKKRLLFYRPIDEVEELRKQIIQMEKKFADDVKNKSIELEQLCEKRVKKEVMEKEAALIKENLNNESNNLKLLVSKDLEIDKLKKEMQSKVNELTIKYENMLKTNQDEYNKKEKALNDKIASLEAKLENVNKLYNETRNNFVMLSEKNKELTENYNMQIKEYASLEKKYNLQEVEKNKKIDELVVQLENVNKLYNEAKNTIAVLNNQNDELKKQVALKNKEINEIKTESASNLHKLMLEKNLEIDKIKSNLELCEKKHADANNKYLSCGKEIENLKSSHNKMMTACNDEKAQLRMAIDKNKRDYETFKTETKSLIEKSIDLYEKYKQCKESLENTNIGKK